MKAETPATRERNTRVLLIVLLVAILGIGTIGVAVWFVTKIFMPGV